MILSVYRRGNHSGASAANPSPRDEACAASGKARIFPAMPNRLGYVFYIINASLSKVVAIRTILAKMEEMYSDYY